MDPQEPEADSFIASDGVPGRAADHPRSKYRSRTPHVVHARKLGSSNRAAVSSFLRTSLQRCGVGSVARDRNNSTAVGAGQALRLALRPEVGHLWPLQIACWLRFSLEVTSRQTTYLSIGREGALSGVAL
jgi:hypothetical protein